MPVNIRKIVRHIEETRAENGQDVSGTHLVAWVAAVIENPYPAEYTQDVVTVADELGAEIGELLGPAVVSKADLVGLQGEVEHGSALIHNLRFGNVFRSAAEGTELLPAAEKRGSAGAPIDVPIKHKLDAKTRSHHQTITIQVPDAPHPREILLACVASNAGRPLARLAQFGAEVKKEAGR
jgi:hypothetical protein